MRSRGSEARLARGLTVAARGSLAAGAVILAFCASTQAALACSNATLVGVRGSGQSASDYGGLGLQVGLLARKLGTDLGARGVTFTVLHVNYPAAPVSDLAGTTPALQSYIRDLVLSLHFKDAARELVRNNRFFESISSGELSALAEVRSLIARCPSTQVILVGYSQGAMVVHRAELVIAGEPQLASHLVGTGLIADGDQVPNAAIAAQLGTAHRDSRGVRPYLYDALPGELPVPTEVAFPASTVSICNKYDIVCDFTWDTGLLHRRHGETVHTDSYQADHARFLDEAADWLAKRVRHPVTALAGPVRVVFANGGELWDTNGARAGTGRIARDLDPDDLTPFETKVLFASESREGLWATDGTRAGTHKIPGSVQVFKIAAGKTQAFFIGENRESKVTLWVTNGRSMREISGVTGEASGGFWPSNIGGEIVALGNSAVFTGYDSEGNPSLWISNGTAGGTHEVWNEKQCLGCAPPLGASVLTVIGDRVFFSVEGVYGFGPAEAIWFLSGDAVTHLQEPTPIEPIRLPEYADEYTFVGSEVYFSGPSYTNGTTQGTGGVLRPKTVQFWYPEDMTPFQAGILFSSGKPHSVRTHGELWRADAAPMSAQEIPASGALPGELNPSDITDLGAGALFYGNDQEERRVLWMTNGTTAERVSSESQGAPLFLGGCSEDILAVNGQALFAGPNGGLWITDGSLGGTHVLVKGNALSFCPMTLTAVP